MSYDRKTPAFIRDNPQRYTLYPIHHPDIWNEYKKQQACTWVAEEIDFSKDREQFDEMPPAEQHLIKSVLCFFAGTDAIVSLNAIENFCKEVPVLEAQFCYMFQSYMENVHSESYSMMIDAYISDPVEKDSILRDVSFMESVRRKTEFAERFMKMPDALPSRLMAFVIVEGLFFSTSFAVVFWYKQKNMLQALTKSNTFIARDEGQHVAFGVLIYNKFHDVRLSTPEADDMFREAVAIEKQFVKEMMPEKFAGMNVDLMCQYVEFVADTLRTMLGYSLMYGTKNPFPFMDLLGMDNRDNFFEGVPTQYRNASVMNEARELSFTEDF